MAEPQKKTGFLTEAWFRPLPRRIAVVAVCGAWLAIELIFVRSELWTLLAAGMTAYAVWEFFISEKYRGNARR